MEFFSRTILRSFSCSWTRVCLCLYAITRPLRKDLPGPTKERLKYTHAHEQHLAFSSYIGRQGSSFTARCIQYANNSWFDISLFCFGLFCLFCLFVRGPMQAAGSVLGAREEEIPRGRQPGVTGDSQGSQRRPPLPSPLRVGGGGGRRPKEDQAHLLVSGRE